MIPNKLPKAKTFCGPNKSKKIPAIGNVKANINEKKLLFADTTVALIFFGINL